MSNLSSMTQEELQRLKQLCDAATPGPWEARPTEILAEGCRCLSCWESDMDRWVVDSGDRDLTQADAQLMAAARTALPALIAEVERLRAASLCEYCKCIRDHKQPCHCWNDE